MYKMELLGGKPQKSATVTVGATMKPESSRRDVARCDTRVV